MMLMITTIITTTTTTAATTTTTTTATTNIIQSMNHAYIFAGEPRAEHELRDKDGNESAWNWSAGVTHWRCT